MSSPESSVGRLYDGWHIYNERIVEVVRDLSPEGLMVRPAPERWPIWATIGHTAGMRVYWLCGVFGEPGAERTPFPDARSGIGWEDDLETPRTAADANELPHNPRLSGPAHCLGQPVALGDPSSLLLRSRSRSGCGVQLTPADLIGRHSKPATGASGAR